MECLVVVYYDSDGYSRIGSDGTYFSGLKTVKGVLKRMNTKGFYIPKWAEAMAIFSYPTWYNRSTETLSKCSYYSLYTAEVSHE